MTELEQQCYEEIMQIVAEFIEASNQILQVLKDKDPKAWAELLTELGIEDKPYFIGE